MKDLHILIIENAKCARESIRDLLLKEGYTVSEADNGEKGISLIQTSHIDLILLNYMLPGRNGGQILSKVKTLNPEIDILIITPPDALDIALKTMKAGAIAYITQPIEFEELLILVDRVAERRTLIRENELMRRELKEKGIPSAKIVYRSNKMRGIINMAGRISGSRTPVLLQGEIGTGKELLARLIHNMGPRVNNPIIAVNCGTVEQTLLESELFGHEKGAFNAGTRRRIGRVEEAEGGTLFLGEISEISSPLQVKLLRFLEECEFQRMGGNQILRADVRIIAATDQSLETKVKEGTFRTDLFYRLNVVLIPLPPLRDRKEDLPALIEHFLSVYARVNNKDIVGVTREAQEMLLRYNYPGNLRELENILERAVVIARESLISIEDLPFREADDRSMTDMKTEVGILRQSIEEVERKMIVEAMSRAADHQTKAAETLGISERMLRYKLKKYGLKE